VDSGRGTSLTLLLHPASAEDSDEELPTISFRQSDRFLQILQMILHQEAAEKEKEAR
jgi:hypothetical protein